MELNLNFKNQLRFEFFKSKKYSVLAYCLDTQLKT